MSSPMERCGPVLLYPYPGVTSVKLLWMKFGRIQTCLLSCGRRTVTLRVNAANASIKVYAAGVGGGLMLTTETISPKIPFASFAIVKKWQIVRFVLEYLSTEGKPWPKRLAKSDFCRSEIKSSATGSVSAIAN